MKGETIYPLKSWSRCESLKSTAILFVKPGPKACHWMWSDWLSGASAPSTAKSKKAGADGSSRKQVFCFLLFSFFRLLLPSAYWVLLVPPFRNSSRRPRRTRSFHLLFQPRQIHFNQLTQLRERN